MGTMAHRITGLKRASLSGNDIETTNLADKRQQNNLHLKGTLESIYEKYSRDFSEVGDEVNILTGEVVINRGHVDRMRTELDIGIGQPSRPRRSWISTLVKEESDVEEDELEQEDKDDDEDELDICPRPKLSKGERFIHTPEAVVQTLEVCLLTAIAMRYGDANLGRIRTVLLLLLLLLRRLNRGGKHQQPLRRQA
jgi:hypothetical protein